MKKRISQALAIVLTIALLTSTFVMLGMPTVSADDTVATEIVRIGDSGYTVLSNEIYKAYDSMASAISKLESGAEVSFANTAWSLQGTKPWGGGAFHTPYYVAGSGTYEKVISFYTGNSQFGMNGATLYNNSLYLNPGNSWDTGTTHILQLNYNVTKDGKVILYDLDGAFTVPTTNTLPYYAWLSGDATQKAQFEIYKNDELIWPLNNEDNLFETAGLSIEFPDLGAIDVVEGDVLSVKVSGNGSRTGVIMKPAVAYIYEIPVETQRLEIGNSVYYVNKNENYNVYDEFNTLTKDMEPGSAVVENETASLVDFTNSKWSMSYKFGDDKGYGITPWNAEIGYEYCVPYTGTPSVSYNGIQVQHYLVTASYVTSWYNGAVTYIPAADSSQQNKVYVSPTAAGSSGIAAVTNPAMKLTFSAYRNGNIVLYDTTGKFSSDGAEYDPFYANESNKPHEWVQLKIYKNDTLIWPTDGEDKIVSFSNKEIAFPDIGEISVNYGDEISIEFIQNPEYVAARSGVFCNPAVAYIDENPEMPAVDVEDDVVIGDKSYTLYSDNIYNVYDYLNEAVQNLTPAATPTSEDEISAAPQVDFSTGDWKVSLTEGTNSWKAAAYFKGALTGGKQYNELFFRDVRIADAKQFYNGAITFDPVHGMVINAGTSVTWGGNKAFKFEHTVSQNGKVVLYDTDGQIVALANNEIPYYCWHQPEAYVDINVYKNGTLVWPLNGEDNRVQCAETFEFPAIEIDVLTNDVITIEVLTPEANSRTCVAADFELAYVHEHDENVVVTEGTHYIPGTRNGNCMLCGNTYTDAPVINTDPVVILDDVSVEYDPATDKFSFTVIYDKGFIKDYEASLQQNLLPKFNFKYKIGDTVKDIPLVPTDGANTIEFSGFNANTLDKTLTVSFHMAWGGKDDGTGTWISYVKKEDGSWRWTDAYEVFTFVPSDYIASEDSNLVNAFNTLKNTIASTESEAANVAAAPSANNAYKVNQADVNIKDGTAFIWLTMDDTLKNQIKANTAAGYDAAGRNFKYVLTIGGVEYDVKPTALTTGLKFEIRGLSYSQIFDKISVVLVVEYTDENADDIISTAIECDFAQAITDSDNAVAIALKDYMNNKSGS